MITLSIEADAVREPSVQKERKKIFEIYYLIAVILLIFFSFVFSSPVLASTRDSVIVRRGIAYCDRHPELTRLDLYLPAVKGASRPGVLLIHGGGWRGGNRGQWAELAHVLASSGYVCASTSYRLAPDYIFPAAISFIIVTAQNSSCICYSLHLCIRQAD